MYVIAQRASCYALKGCGSKVHKILKREIVMAHLWGIKLIAEYHFRCSTKAIIGNIRAKMHQARFLLLRIFLISCTCSFWGVKYRTL